MLSALQISEFAAKFVRDFDGFRGAEGKCYRAILVTRQDIFDTCGMPDDAPNAEFALFCYKLFPQFDAQLDRTSNYVILHNLS